MSRDPDWLNLSEAAALLGVHPATVRAWADRGELPTARTPGGHRRFRRADVVARARAVSRPQARSAAVVIQNALGKTRLELAEGGLDAQAWYRHLTAAERQQLAGLGRRLLQTTQRFLADQGNEVPAAATALGEEYERLGRASGLSLAETVRAYLYFREFLFRTLYDMVEATGVQGPTDWGDMHQRVTRLSNEILLALIAAREAAARSDHQAPTRRRPKPDDDQHAD